MKTKEKECKRHKLTTYRHDGKVWRCSKCRAEAVQKRREKTKLLAVKYKGGKCQICGYNKCIAALEFHHRNPQEKSFGISQGGNSRSWDKVQKELDKCDLLCSNCHKEVEYSPIR